MQVNRSLHFNACDLVVLDQLKASGKFTKVRQFIFFIGKIYGG